MHPSDFPPGMHPSDFPPGMHPNDFPPGMPHGDFSAGMPRDDIPGMHPDAYPRRRYPDCPGRYPDEFPSGSFREGSPLRGERMRPEMNNFEAGVRSECETLIRRQGLDQMVPMDGNQVYKRTPEGSSTCSPVFEILEKFRIETEGDAQMILKITQKLTDILMEYRLRSFASEKFRIETEGDAQMILKITQKLTDILMEYRLRSFPSEKFRIETEGDAQMILKITQKLTDILMEYRLRSFASSTESKLTSIETHFSAFSLEFKTFKKELSAVSTLVADNTKAANLCKSRVDQLELKMADKEDRSRRNNLRLVGLKEGAEGIYSTISATRVYLERGVPGLFLSRPMFWVL
ncbi:UNVERIFIED_CONTAM: hypothetical protein FKN15_062907 [Acipenser sinensis]